MKLKLIEKLSNSFGAPGFEDDVVELLKGEVKNFSRERDCINNLYFGLEDRNLNKLTVAIDAHSDEVGFMVKEINKNGSISFLTLGGWVSGNIPCTSVIIKNNRGEFIKGVVASKPPHFMSEEERKKAPVVGDMTIDIGSSSYEETTEIYGIEIGNPIVPEVHFSYDSKNKVMRGKAFDNRLGCAGVVEVLNNIDTEKLDVNVVGIVASQEENGCRGAQVASQKVKPDFVIVFEGSPADDTFKDAFLSRGALGKGVQLRVIDSSMISNPRVIQFAKKIAEREKIDFQIIARDGGGTNAGKYHVANEGIPVLVLGVPTRYIHTPYSYASLKDYEAMVNLTIEILKEINEDIIKKF